MFCNANPTVVLSSVSMPVAGEANETFHNNIFWCTLNLPKETVLSNLIKFILLLVWLPNYNKEFLVP